MNKKYLIIPLIVIIAVICTYYCIDNFTTMTKTEVGESYFSVPWSYTTIDSNKNEVKIDNGTNKITIRELNGKKTIDEEISKYQNKTQNDSFTIEDLAINNNTTIKKTKIVKNNTTTTRYWFTKNDTNYCIITKNSDAKTDNVIKTLYNSLKKKKKK